VIQKGGYDFVTSGSIHVDWRANAGTYNIFRRSIRSGKREFVVVVVYAESFIKGTCSVLIIALLATGFLLGPKTQCNKMWHPTRRYTTAFYLIMLIVVLGVACGVSFSSSVYLHRGHNPLYSTVETKYWPRTGAPNHRNYGGALVQFIVHSLW
jgi:hypothetical protein